MNDAVYPTVRGKLKYKVQAASVLRQEALGVESLESKDKMLMGFVEELKRVLDQEHLELMIQDIFNIESKLDRLAESCSWSCHSFIDNFYKGLAPLLLRSMVELPSTVNDSLESQKEAFKEALRIAIEEEIYFLAGEIGEGRSGTFS